MMSKDEFYKQIQQVFDRDDLVLDRKLPPMELREPRRQKPPKIRLNPVINDEVLYPRVGQKVQQVDDDEAVYFDQAFGVN